MNEHRYNVTFYLEKEAAEAFEEYRQKKGLTAYEGVSFLVDDFLVKGSKVERESSPSHLLKERVSRLEGTLDNWVTSMFRCAQKNEKLEERVAELQDEVEKIKRLLSSWL